MRLVSLCAVVSSLVGGLALPLHAAADPSSLFQSAFDASFEAANSKITSLIGAFPDDKLEWRPADGIFSVREVILHVAATNYYLGTMAGAKLPEGVDPRALAAPDATKAELLKVAERSIEFARRAVASVGDSELSAEVELFGKKTSRMRFILIFSEHAHEHLGQLIAYARSNEVTPPWSKPK